ncbi:hypothetical protein EDC40_1215 [Aminobacter aminovorans]|jgi:hypothetical protein|uniref:Glycoside hydrolase family 42 N-terminal domain-containing protein n=1 Tax=Aminobacter aminovorans TaxID=83263 RepID=A0A380WHE3_AMIAI|nr:hypothetical protein [Aminobacter aminovorans]TCS19719.1 hypothetical protein EDC40_1215 [Aminobacter aminovorans]SUU88413.1 Uncharacterised protein [Aminobacter aminovorans]
MKLKRLLGAVVTLGAAIAATSSMAWDNPANRYENAYKQYTGATCPLAADKIEHFVYFSRDRDAIRDHAFLTNDRFVGAQIMYAWRQLEPTEGHYDFSLIQSDVDYLAKHGKRLFIQLQEASFSPEYKPVPDYLLKGDYDGGITAQHTDDGAIEGWVAKRWNAKVQARFAALLAALGKQFDGVIEGINLQETAIGVSPETDSSFTPDKYVAALKTNMQAMKIAFPTSTTMLYANFMPGEWLPWEDKGYLRGIYEFGDKIGVGMGAPDLMYMKKGQLNHALTMMHEGKFTVPLGIAVQDGNYVGETGSTNVVAKRSNLVPSLHAFAQDFLKVRYMFWVNQEPYFEEDVLPCFPARKG